MLKIKRLNITQITLKGFRSYKDEVVFNTGDLTFISGDNGKGKSSIAHAIAYAFYGVDAFGVQDIGRIRNNKSNSVTVKIVFTDENGESHNFVRTRNGDNTELVLDGHKIRQSDVETMFRDKDTFLSLFNPSYFAEVLGSKGREFLEVRLPNVKHEDVLQKLSENERKLLTEIDISVPEASLKKKRGEIKQYEEEKTYICGQLSELKSGKAEREKSLYELETKVAKLTDIITTLKARRFDGINEADLSAEMYLLEDKLKNENSDKINHERAFLESAVLKYEDRVYDSKFNSHIQEKRAKLNALSFRYNDFKKRLSEIKEGDKCPSCLVEITVSNIASVQENLKMQMKDLLEEGKAEKEKLEELNELESKCFSEFEKSKDEFVSQAKQRLRDFNKDNPENHREVYNRLSEIQLILKQGNLTDGEYTVLCDAESELVLCRSKLEDLKSSNTEKRIEELRLKLENLDVYQDAAKKEIHAINQYIAKRSDIALSFFKTDNVRISFYEIVKSTGELKSCFKVLYDEREYPTLSLSEKIKAGLEISSMLRKVLGLDYPVFIDNSESIGAYDGIELPTQTFIMKFTKGAQLKVISRSNSNQQAA